MDQRVLQIDLRKLTGEERVTALNAIFQAKQILEQRGLPITMLKKRTPPTPRPVTPR